MGSSAAAISQGGEATVRTRWEGRVVKAISQHFAACRVWWFGLSDSEWLLWRSELE